MSVKNHFLSYMLPGLLLGATGGYFFAEIPHLTRGRTLSTHSPRAAFLSTVDDSVDYDKLAKVCLNAAARHEDGAGFPALAVSVRPPDPEETKKTREYLDRLMSNALEKGAWTRIMAFRARQLMGQLPPSDAADFASLFESALKHGDLTVTPGAWVPTDIN